MLFQKLIDGYHTLKNIRILDSCFFFTSNDTDYIIKGLKHFSFPIPVFIDKKSKYEGYAFIAFVLNNKNEIVTTSNPTFSNFEKLLKSQLRKNK